MAIRQESPQPVQTESAKRDPRALSLRRALLLGTLLIPLNVFWVILAEVRWNTSDGTSLPLFITPIFLLFVLVALNLAWRKWVPRSGAALRQEELLLIYIMLVVSCTFCGHDTGQNLFGVIAHAVKFATPDNKWHALFFRFLPHDWIVTDPDAVTAYYQGNISIYSPVGLHYLRAWVVPLTLWGIFLLTLVGMYLCLTILVRKAWIENEKLTFPLVQLPLAITADDAGTNFFRKPLLWAGFGLAMTTSFVAGLHQIIPSFPEVNVKLLELHDYATTRPLSAIGSTRSSLYPFAIGMAYFMPLDLSFSCWFFFLAARVFRVVGSVWGWDSSENQGFPYFGEQAAGAWFGLGVMLLYTGRRSWAAVWKSVREGARAEDPAEATRYRAALMGLLIGAMLLSLFSTMVGLAWWVSLIFFGVVFLLGFTITRVRAELGSPHEIVWVNPIQVLLTFFGSRAIGAHDLTVLSTLYWFNRGYRNHPMPNQLEAFKMLDDKPAVPFKGIVTALTLAMIVSLLSTYWANLHVTYAAGAAGKALSFKTWVGGESFGRLESWIKSPIPAASTGLNFIIGGFALTVLLSIMRTTFVWWPFHPAGYALALSYAMEYFWMPVMIAWLLKFLIIRYGGVKMYRTAIPFFLGLILGDYTMGSIWTLVSLVMGIPTYKVYI